MSVLCTYAYCENTSSKTCSRCKIARYCSIECQKKHYPDHKEQCIRHSETNAYASTTVLPDEDYNEQIKIIEKNGHSFIFDNFGIKIKVIRRIDGNIYEEKTGDIIRNRYWLENQRKVEPHFKENSNWDVLMRKYIKPIHIDDGIAIFLDKEQGRLIRLDIKTDTVG